MWKALRLAEVALKRAGNRINIGGKWAACCRPAAVLVQCSARPGTAPALTYSYTVHTVGIVELL